MLLPTSNNQKPTNYDTKVKMLSPIGFEPMTSTSPLLKFLQASLSLYGLLTIFNSEILISWHSTVALYQTELRRRKKIGSSKRAIAWANSNGGAERVLTPLFWADGLWPIRAICTKSPLKNWADGLWPIRAICTKSPIKSRKA